MKTFLKINTLLFTLLVLSGCVAAEYFLKRAINDFEGDIVKEVTNLADFSSEQKASIVTLAATMDQWLRVERLPLAQTSLLTLAADIELDGQIQTSTWYAIVDYLQEGLQTSRASHLVNQYSEFVAGLTDSQVEQMALALDEELQSWLKKSKDKTIEKQNKRIVGALKWTFRAVGQPLTRTQRRFSKDFLSKRKVDLEFQKQVKVKETSQFIEIISQASKLETSQLNADIKEYLSKVENSRDVPDLEDWLYNRDLFLELLNNLIADLNKDQQKSMAKKIRRYEIIFGELAVVE